MNRKQLTIGLFGFGCVGKGLYEVLQKTPALKASIKSICVKTKNKQRSLSNQYFTFEKNDILQDDTINTIVELIDDADAAFEIVKTALQKGKAVVTANKKMIAEHFEELLHLQKQYNVPLLYEAACCASIPIIRNLEEYYDNDLLESIEGIVNGSTNYILTKTVEKNISFSLALKEAQQKGFAETNPLLDVGGFDAKYKLQILLAHAFGVITQPQNIFNLGINNLYDFELNYAKEKGYKIKLVAYASKNEEGKIISFVLPKFVTSKDKLFSVDDVFNGVKIQSYFCDNQFFVGKGAGAYPTSSAVLSDISALTYDYRYEYKKLNTQHSLANEEDIFLKIFLRFSLPVDFEFKPFFKNIEEYYFNENNGFIIGTCSLKCIKEIVAIRNIETSIILFDIIKRDFNYQTINNQKTEYELSY
ncbi:MAG: homoserine dehydrogenase [Chitinophagaceae bacterium]|nr:homoserine dehydrogenase [Chitinophagaceae bacterium]